MSIHKVGYSKFQYRLDAVKYELLGLLDSLIGVLSFGTFHGTYRIEYIIKNFPKSDKQ